MTGFDYAIRKPDILLAPNGASTDESAMAYDPAQGSEITILSRRSGSELHAEIHPPL